MIILVAIFIWSTSPEEKIKKKFKYYNKLFEIKKVEKLPNHKRVILTFISHFLFFVFIGYFAYLFDEIRSNKDETTEKNKVQQTEEKSEYDKNIDSLVKKLKIE